MSEEGIILKRVKTDLEISKFYDLMCISALVREAIEANFNEENQTELELLHIEGYHRKVYLYYRMNEEGERTSNFPMTIVVGNNIYSLKGRGDRRFTE
ncbi:MAG: hypothetical protein GF411_19895 [Candidatus Lokiarchaeota archaeon]|nr:hypothetical protein [Candidatus Lokiarchaeota archaeon]